jgi:hypothetical protein
MDASGIDGIDGFDGLAWPAADGCTKLVDWPPLPVRRPAVCEKIRPSGHRPDRSALLE